MVKTKQSPDPQDTGINSDAAAFMNDLKTVLTGLKSGMETLNKNQNELNNKILENTRRINNVAKEATELAQTKPKGLNPMEIFQQINGILNSPLVAGLMEKVLGGQNEPMPNAEQPISDSEREYLLGVKKDNDALQKRWFEAMVSGLEAETKKKMKESEADW